MVPGSPGTGEPRGRGTVDITIGVQHLTRELIIESDQTSDEVSTLVEAALGGKSVLELRDVRGRRVLVPTSSIGYVEIGSEETRRVGFGSL